MRKLSRYMMRNILCISVILLLIASVTPASVSALQLPTISLNPQEYTVSAPGETFTIDVNITNVDDMKGYQFKLWFNTTLLNVTGADAIGQDLEGNVIPGEVNDVPTGPPIYAPLDEGGDYWVPLRNVTRGLVEVMVAFLMGSYTGSGTLITINFTALEEGTGALHLNETILGNSTGDPISHMVSPPGLVQATITVIPEFPIAIFASLLLIATLAATFLGKTVWSRKRRRSAAA